MADWDKRFMRLAEHIASWSKDPSTKCGAVIVDRRNRIVSVGFNGFPAGVKDSAARYNDREEKYKFVVHAEKNAILFAGRDLSGCSLYVWPIPPCSQCAAAIVQAGILWVFSPMVTDAAAERWADSIRATGAIFMETGVTWLEI